MKNTLLILCFGLLMVALAGAGCAPAADQASDQATGKKGDVGDNICAQFDADFTYSAIGKPIAYMNASPSGDIAYCQYFTDYKDDFYKVGGTTQPGGPWIAINAVDLSVERQKRAAEVLGWTVQTDERIKMEHFMSVQEDGVINKIDLVINPDRYVSLNRSSAAVITNEELIIWTSLVAEKIQGRLSLDIKENPLGNEVRPFGGLLSAEPEEAPEVGESQQAVAQDFLNFLSEMKWDEAVAMMDANAATKAMWKTNFETIKSLEVKKIETVYTEEWTDSRQVFKATLDVSVTGQGEQYGWNNGENFRWISLQKNSGAWQIHELANNP